MRQMVIYKYELPITPGLFEIKLPMGAVILGSPVIQYTKIGDPHPDGHVFLYANVPDPKAMMLSYNFIACWTGLSYNLPHWANFLGSIQIYQNVHGNLEELVVHYFNE